MSTSTPRTYCKTTIHCLSISFQPTKSVFPLSFLTIHGTLLAHNVTSDPTISVKAFRKFSAFAGPTFGLHDTAIATTGKVSPNPGFFGGRVLKVFTRGDGKGLKSMIVEQDEIVGVVVYCKDDTLIAAQLPKDSFPSDDDLLAKPQKLELDNNDAAIGQIHGNQGDASDESSVDEDEDGASNSSKRKGKSRSEDTTDEEENKPSRMRILELRAEAIAEVMVEDELKDFVMPKDFH